MEKYYHNQKILNCKEDNYKIKINNYKKNFIKLKNS